MRKLKVGDKVELSEAAGVNEKGDIGIITEIGGDNDARVKVKGNGNRGNWSLLTDLKLIKN